MYCKFIEFLKNHNLYDEEIISYFKNNTTRFDYLEEEKRQFISTYPICKNGHLDRIGAFIPYPDSDKTVMMNIHAYVYYLLLYSRIGENYTPSEDEEVLPMFFERLYVLENPTVSNVNYYNYMKECIYETNKCILDNPNLNYYDYMNMSASENKNDQYVLAMDLSDDLLKYYKKQDIKELDKKVKSLVLRREIRKTANKTKILFLKK